MQSDDADLEHWLREWSRWMKWNIGELPDGYPTCGCGFEGTPSNYAVSESDGEDYWRGHVVPAILGAVDAAIDSLEPDQKRAIWWKHGLTRVEPPNAPSAYTAAFRAVRVYVIQRVAIAA